MKSHQAGRRAVALLCAVALMSGCYGPFNLTRRLHHWNGQTGGRWTNEFVFLAFAILQVYDIAALGDALIFNSIEFWTGNNPITPPMTAQTQTKTLAQGSQRAVLERTDSSDGRHMSVKLYDGDQMAQEFSLEASIEGPTLMKDAQGIVVGQAQTLPDGTLVLSDASGQQTARYSPKQLDRLAKKYSAASAQ